MAYLIAFGLAAILLPVLSSRGWWFAGLALAAVGAWFAGVWICSEVETGWGGLICALYGILGGLVVIGSLAFGLFRVIHSRNGTRTIDAGTLLAAGFIIYTIVGLVIFGIIRLT